ncbi:MAG: coproporphyrinogen III oxidase family protein [Candidatus Aminicenantes bacterium]|nr:coproporphyrinogen III oxidase family protein [Candidatus Aminicenantes bacterium]
METTGLYIHFPFCRSKCPYCHFASDRWDEAKARAWRDGIAREAGLYGGLDLKFDSLYLGGGTPSLLSGDDVAGLAGVLGAALRTEFREFTLEANPGRLDPLVMRGWKAAGVTRLSLGVQSFDDRVLKTLGREHSAAESIRFYQACREAGFDNVNLDFMIGVPGEGGSRAAEILERIGRLVPDHVSVYILEEVEGLPFDAVMRGNPPDDDAVAADYEEIGRGLSGLGYEHYEISNFCRPGRRCFHNLKYWRYEPFLGLGPSACSHLGNRRWCNRKDVDLWGRALADGGDPKDEVLILDPDRQAAEAVIFGLRLREGIRPSEIRERFGLDILERYREAIGELAHEGWLRLEEDRISISEERRLLSNRVFSAFV